MNLDLQELAARREALVARSASERSAIVLAAAQIERKVSIADRAIALIGRLRAQPVLIAAAIGLLLGLGPRRGIRWVGRGIALVSLLRPLRRFLDAGARAQARPVSSRERPES